MNTIRRLSFPSYFRLAAFACALVFIAGCGSAGSGGGTTTPPGVAPSITTAPVSTTTVVGQTATFSVTASGSTPLTYQWTRNGVNIGGATSSSYTTGGTLWSDGGAQIRVVVTNATGSVTSVAATLTVNPATTVDVATYHDDISRSGLTSTEVELTQGNVTSVTFGKVGFFSMDGLVDAEPLLLSNVTIPGQGVHDVVYAVSENDSVYAFDATTGQVLWQVSVLGSGETASDDRSCSQVTPKIGITSTPVIDRSRGPNGAIYLVAMSKNGGTYFQRLHALDLTTGAELFGGPHTISATFPGTGDDSNGTNVIFDPSQYKERTGLLLLNGQIYTSWASHCDDRPYTGWFMAFNETTLAQTSVLNVTPNGYDGAIWMSGGGLAADSSGYIYALDGNGIFDTTLNAGNLPSKGDYGNAFLKLSTSSGLAVNDYFEMDNGVSESSNDVDLGSGGVMVLPDLTDVGNTVWHLAVGAGKDGNLYVVNRNSMGKFSSGSNGNYQFLSGVLGSGIWSVPAYFNNTVYYGPTGGSILAFPITNAKLAGAPSSQSPTTYEYPGALPSISANGATNGILWAVENNGSAAVLHAYNATNLGTELYNSNQAAGSRDHFGVGNKYITPMIANGRVYVGTPSGVAVFGLLP
jgi:outer membrane protein assembly factor BamB